MILARAMVDADEQVVVFLDERLDQRPVFGGQAGRNGGEGRILRQPQLEGDVALVLFAFAARGGDGIGLGIDGGDALEQVLGLALHHSVLLVVEQGEHFAVFLQFFAQGFDEILKQFIHGFMRRRLPWTGAPW